MGRVIRALVSVFVHCAFRIKIAGKENVPKDGGAILAVNHKSNWDPVVIGSTCPRSLKMMGKAELFKNPVCGYFLKALGGFPVNRGKGDIGAIKTSLKTLKGGDMLLIFPEGTRNNDTVAHAKSGVALIGNMAQVPVIPAYISGKYRFLSKVVVTFGTPYDMTRFGGEKLDSAKLQEVSDEILMQIRGLKQEI